MITDEDQALEFPRYGLVDRNRDDIDQDEIPVDLISATCYMAQKVRENFIMYDNGDIFKETSNIESERHGNHTVKYNKDATTKRYPLVDKYLRPFILPGNCIMRVN